MMTWVLLIFGMYATTLYVILPWLGYSLWGCVHLILFNGGSLFGMYCHWTTMTTDPGSVPRDCVPLPDDVQEQDFKAVIMESGGNGHSLGHNRTRSASQAHIPTYVRKYRKFCKRCRAFKPIRAHHCSICGRCIIKMDHHCPWVNNCVGIGNQKLFLLFLLSVNICCIHSLVLVIAKFMSCSSSTVETIDNFKGITSQSISRARNHPMSPAEATYAENKNTDIYDLNMPPSAADLSPCGSQDQNIMIIFLLLESLLFGLFTLCMMGDQTTVLSNNQTQIDKLKGDKHEGVEGFNEVFGCDSDVKFRYDWVLPVPTTFPDQAIKDQVMGYRMLGPGEVEKKSRNGSRDASPHKEDDDVQSTSGDRESRSSESLNGQDREQVVERRKRNGGQQSR
jgi:palmitoyltransferase